MQGSLCMKGIILQQPELRRLTVPQALLSLHSNQQSVTTSGKAEH